MSSQEATRPDAPEENPPERVGDRYTELETGCELVVYDRKNHTAWLQSDMFWDREAWL